MRISLIIAILITLPALYLGWADYTRYQSNPANGFTFATVGEVWRSYDLAGFEQYKATYIPKPREWEREVRPRLDMKAFPIAVAPAAIYDLGLLICFLLGVGPYRPHNTASGFSRRKDF